MNIVGEDQMFIVGVLMQAIQQVDQDAGDLVYIKTHSRMILQRTKSYIQHMDDLARKCLCHAHARIEAVFMLQGRIPFILKNVTFSTHQPFITCLSRPWCSRCSGIMAIGLACGMLCNPPHQHPWIPAQKPSRSRWFYKQLDSFPTGTGPFHLPSALEPIPQTPTAWQEGEGSWACHPLVAPASGSHHLRWKCGLRWMRVERFFPFSDTLQAGLTVLAEALVWVLLCDLYDRMIELPLKASKEILLLCF